MERRSAPGEAIVLRRRAAPPQVGGFTFLGILIAIALLGMALASAAALWSTTSQRDREAELLFVGAAFRDGIRSYYTHSPGVAAYPRELEDLIEDKRFPMVRRHLRRIYSDPITGRNDWELIRNEAGFLIGVQSSSHKAPIKRANFDVEEAGFEGAECYCDWRFVFVPGRGPRTPRRG